MAKVAELHSRVQTLSAEKQQLSHQANTYADKTHEQERILALGESKLQGFARQLATSLKDQELRISREVSLKRELHSVQVELEKARRRS